MTKNECVTLFRNLNTLGNLKGVKFAYGVSRNLALLKPELESLEKASEFTEEYKEFEKKRVALVETFTKKNEKGKSIQKNNQYELVEGKQTEMDEAFEKLKNENHEVWDARVKQVDEYNELLKTESNIVLFKINLSDVPSDISVQQLHGISAIIEEAIASPYSAK